MMVGFLVLAIAGFVFWLVFLKLKLLRLTPGWVFGFSVVVLHLMLIFVIGLRFVTPQSANATVVQHTIQLIPRLSEPTLVTAVLVEDNTEVKKGQPLFQFDRHRLRIRRSTQIEAQLAAAKQNVKVLKADIEVAMQSDPREHCRSWTYYRNMRRKSMIKLAKQNSAAAEDVRASGGTASTSRHKRRTARGGGRARSRQSPVTNRKSMASTPSVANYRGAAPAGAILPRQHDAEGARGRPHRQSPGAPGHGVRHLCASAASRP